MADTQLAMNKGYDL